MKALILLISSFALTSLYALDMSDLLAWEKAAQSFLGNSKVEVYALKITGENVTFKYDLEDEQDPYLDITFECSGLGKIENGQPSFVTLTCEEEEPTLWDEF